MSEEDVKPNALLDSECVLPPDHPVPPEQLRRYSVDRDPFAEQDIADYVQGQARDETVTHVELIKREVVLGEPYDIWDVTTDQGRWWVITNLTNLYSQQHFPSLDYTLSFHVGLMARLRSRTDSPDGNDPTPFEEVIRRFDQVQDRLGHAVEVEDLQAIGMLLREGLISLTTALQRRVDLPTGVETPQVANFTAWTDALLNVLCAGGSNERLRQHLKSHAKETWQLVNWLTHSRSVDRVATEIAFDACGGTLSTFVRLLERQRRAGTDECPMCRSRNIRTFYDIDIPPEGEYFLSCGACEWTNHPGLPEVIEGTTASP